MYQYSLQYIQKLFRYSMDIAEKNQNVEGRLVNLIESITREIYKNVTRGLFEKDKILFSFMIATSINKNAKVITEDIWSTFSRGPNIVEKINSKPNPNKNLFTTKAWELAEYL